MGNTMRQRIGGGYLIEIYGWTTGPETQPVDKTGNDGTDDDNTKQANSM